MAARDPIAEALAPETEQVEGARRQEIEDIKWLMAHKQGRRIVWRLLGEAGVYRTSFSTNGSVTSFNEGKRQLGLLLVGEINEHCPDAFLMTLKENGK